MLGEDLRHEICEVKVFMRFGEQNSQDKMLDMTGVEREFPGRMPGGTTEEKTMTDAHSFTQTHKISQTYNKKKTTNAHSQILTAITNSLIFFFFYKTSCSTQVHTLTKYPKGLALHL